MSGLLWRGKVNLKAFLWRFVRIHKYFGTLNAEKNPAICPDLQCLNLFSFIHWINYTVKVSNKIKCYSHSFVFQDAFNLKKFQGACYKEWHLLILRVTFSYVYFYNQRQESKTCNTTANYSLEKLDTERRKLIKYFNILYLLKNLPIFPLFERLNKSFSSLKENQHLFQN